MPNSTSQKLLAEALGTALLLAVVIGSGIMAERLSGGSVAIALLANTLATVGGLYVLIEMFGNNLFPRVSELPYLLTLGPYQSYWFRLRRV